MCETFGRVEHLPVFGSQFGSSPLAVGRRGGANIDNDVIDRSRAAADEFGFGVWLRLVMQPSKSTSPCIPGNAALNQLWI